MPELTQELKLIVARAEEVFGKEWQRWWITSNEYFGTRPLVYWLTHKDGYEKITDELGRIEHGLFA